MVRGLTDICTNSLESIIVGLGFGFFLRPHLSCLKPARTGVQAEPVVRAWAPAAAGCIGPSTGEGKITTAYAAAIHATGAPHPIPHSQFHSFFQKVESPAEDKQEDSTVKTASAVSQKIFHHELTPHQLPLVSGAPSIHGINGGRPRPGV
jgi:hypothetical protein